MQAQCSDEWVDVPETNGQYQVSRSGAIRSVPCGIRRGRQRGRVLNPSPNAARKGYVSVRLCVTGKPSRIVAVHRIVAAVFIGPCPDGLQVNHKDGNKANNAAENLEYVTCRENIRHCWKNNLHGTEHCRGANNRHSKLTEDQVREIRQLSGTIKQTELAKRFSVTSTTICAIVARKLWKHI